MLLWDRVHASNLIKGTSRQVPSSIDVTGQGRIFKHCIPRKAARGERFRSAGDFFYNLYWQSVFFFFVCRKNVNLIISYDL